MEPPRPCSIVQVQSCMAHRSFAWGPLFTRAASKTLTLQLWPAGEHVAAGRYSQHPYADGSVWDVSDLTSSLCNSKVDNQPSGTRGICLPSWSLLAVCRFASCESSTSCTAEKSLWRLEIPARCSVPISLSSLLLFVTCFPTLCTFACSGALPHCPG